MMMCTRCKKRPAVVFITQMNAKDPEIKRNEGLCLVCAKELGISQVDDYMKQPNPSYNTINRAYFNIPNEARANEYGGVDIDELIKLNNEYNEKYKGKITTIDIKTLEIRPEINDGKNDDENVQGNN